MAFNPRNRNPKDIPGKEIPVRIEDMAMPQASVHFFSNFYFLAGGDQQFTWDRR